LRPMTARFELVLLASLLTLGCSDPVDSGTGLPDVPTTSDLVVAADAPDVAAEPDVAVAPDVPEEPDTTEPSDEGPGVDVPPDGPDTGCRCVPTSHCDASGACVEDVCLEGATTCASLEQISICNADGSAAELIDCDGSTACYLGECLEQVCEPGQDAVCQDGQLLVCNGLGLELTLLPCPGGTACEGGICAPIEPNVIVLVDTSGSMNQADELGGTLADCVGDSCAPWTWPLCDAAAAPMTRLGKVKVALQGALGSAIAGDVRMALMRFPQLLDILGGGAAPTCAGAGLKGFGKIFSEEHALEAEQVTGDKLTSVLPVPFSADAQSDQAPLLQWLDFEHTFLMSETECVLALSCDGKPGNKWCLDNQCAEQLEPELSATGGTPIGRSLFYAGEYLRHNVIVQGRVCIDDASCGSPHYACVDGTCHDPHRACRPTVIVLLSDGAESFDTFPEKFFHPFIQAKRLQYGLGCSADADCAGEATCMAGTCQPGSALPDKVCHLTDVPCQANPECSEYKYPCGPAQTCSGKCEATGLTWTDASGDAQVLRDPAGDPISVTIHVVDASPFPVGGKTIAALGGGQHLPVNLDDPQSIIDVFLPLIDLKDTVDCGP
jgi:hypothetical protein